MKLPERLLLMADIAFTQAFNSQPMSRLPFLMETGVVFKPFCPLVCLHASFARCLEPTGLCVAPIEVIGTSGLRLTALGTGFMHHAHLSAITICVSHAVVPLEQWFG
jgi:hypothetical protein